MGQFDVFPNQSKDCKPDEFIVGSKRMVMLRKEKSWHAAKSDCESRGMRLLTLSTKKENDQLRDYFNERIWGRGPVYDQVYWYLWTSGTDVEKEGVWKWATTGNNFTDSSWGSDEPGGGRGENCMEMRMVTSDDCLWNDTICDLKKPYICEIDDFGLQ